MSGPTASRTAAISSTAMRMDSTGSRRLAPSSAMPVSDWPQRTNFQPSSTSARQSSTSSAVLSPPACG